MPLSPLEGSGSRQHIGLPSLICKIHLSRSKKRSQTKYDVCMSLISKQAVMELSSCYFRVL